MQSGGAGDGDEEPQEAVMVHSSSTPPMKTPPSSPTSTLPATAPSLQVIPPVPPPGDTTDQHLNQIPGKSQLTDFTSISDLTSPALCDAPPTVASIVDLSSPSPSSPSQAASSVQASVNGRTSGRKRTPKACDCCGPNSVGHNVTTPGRGRGRGRGGGGRGRGRGGRGRARGGSSSSSSSSSSELWHTPKRKVQGEWTHVKIFEDTNEGDDSTEEMETTETCETATEAERLVGTSPEQADAHGRDDGLLGAMLSEATAKEEEGAAEMQVGDATTKSSDSSSATPVLPQSDPVGPSRDAPTGLAKRPNEIAVKQPLSNGDTVSLSDSDSEEEATASGMVNGQGAAGCHVQDLDCEMQVDKQTPDKAISELGTTAPRSDGDSASTDEEHGCTPTDMETCRPPPFQGPVVVSLSQHLWALRDHRLYCNTGTWVKDETEEAVMSSDGIKVNGTLQDEGDGRELLVDLIQGRLRANGNSRSL